MFNVLRFINSSFRSSIHESYPQLDALYDMVFRKGDTAYWSELERDFTDYFENTDCDFFMLKVE